MSYGVLQGSNVMSYWVLQGGNVTITRFLLYNSNIKINLIPIIHILGSYVNIYK